MSHQISTFVSHVLKIKDTKKRHKHKNKHTLNTVLKIMFLKLIFFIDC